MLLGVRQPSAPEIPGLWDTNGLHLLEGAACTDLECQGQEGKSPEGQASGLWGTCP